MIDPLCGTLNYAVRMPVVAVNAALRSKDGALAAAVAEPLSDQIFWTDSKLARARAVGLDTPLVPTAESKLVDLNLDPPFPNAQAFRAVTLAADASIAARRFSAYVASEAALDAWTRVVGSE